jgi:hypothetical protein
LDKLKLLISFFVDGKPLTGRLFISSIKRAAAESATAADFFAAAAVLRCYLNLYSPSRDAILFLSKLVDFTTESSSWSEFG